VLGGELEHAVGVKGVAGAGPVEAVLQALRAGDLLDPGHRGQRLRFGDAVLGGQRPHRVQGLAPRSGRVELERAIRHLDAVTVLEPFQRFLEAALADVAPRTDDVRPDLDPHAILLSSMRGLHESEATLR